MPLELSLQEYIGIIESDNFQNKICIFSGNWNMSDCEKNKKSLFVFDNDNVEQALIRDCENSIGIPTKYSTDNDNNNNNENVNCKNIIKSIIHIVEKSQHYDEIIFPGKGFGQYTFQSHSQTNALIMFINKIIAECFGIEYDLIRKNGLQLMVAAKSNSV